MQDKGTGLGIPAMTHSGAKQRPEGFENPPKNRGHTPGTLLGQGGSLQLHGRLWGPKRWTRMPISPAFLACCPPPAFPTPSLGAPCCLFRPLWQWLSTSAGDMSTSVPVLVDVTWSMKVTAPWTHMQPCSRRPREISFFLQEKKKKEIRGKGSLRGQISCSVGSRHSWPGHALARTQVTETPLQVCGKLGTSVCRLCAGFLPSGGRWLARLPGSLL